jgi:hypothetical protein
VKLSLNMGSIIDNFAVDHDQKLAFKIASYNAMFVILLAICFAGLFAIYNMLYMFLMPILWATLVGTILFPLKKKISHCFGGMFKFKFSFEFEIYNFRMA